MEKGACVHCKDVASTQKRQTLLVLSLFMLAITLLVFAESPWALQGMKQILPLIVSLHSFQ